MPRQHVPAPCSSEFTFRTVQRGELRHLQHVDSAACALFASVGVKVDLPARHPFVLDEARRWATALAAERVIGAYTVLNSGEELVGFAAMGVLDEQPYLDQMSVDPAFMRRGIGARLLADVIARSGALPLWLTTYAHIPWNAAYYARFGFQAAVESECGPELRETLCAQRSALPHP